MNQQPHNVTTTLSRTDAAAAKRKRMTNVEFVKELMENSRHGALAQLFIIDALWKWSTRIADLSDEALCEAFKDHGLVSGDAWQAVAKEIKHKLELRLEGK